MKIFDNSNEDWATRTEALLWVLQKSYRYNKIPPYAGSASIGGTSYTMLFTSREEAEQQLIDELCHLDVPYSIDLLPSSSVRERQELPEALAREFVYEQPRYYGNLRPGYVSRRTKRLLGSGKSTVYITRDTGMRAVIQDADRKVVIRLTQIEL